MKDRSPIEPFVLPIRRIFRVLAVIVCVLIVVSAVAHLLEMYYFRGQVKRLFDMIDADAEQSIPAWYSSIMLAISTVLILGIIHVLKSTGRKAFLFHWGMLAAGFLWLSADESAAIHEVMSNQVRKVVHTGDTWLRFAWVLPAGVIVLLVAAIYVRFLLHLAPRRRRQFIWAGAMYVFGALVLEVIGGKLHSMMVTKETLSYLLCSHVEEFCEMFAIVLFNTALMEHLLELTQGAGVPVRFVADAARVTSAETPPLDSAAPTHP